MAKPEATAGGASSGYSGTPLAKKLGIKADHVVAAINEPSNFRELLPDLADGVTFRSDLDGKPDVVVAFYTEHAELEPALDDLANAVFPERMIWIAWPKKTANVETDLTGDVVRATVLATKLVDVKVCAISDIWSGLKVVWRKEHR
ncbi:MAG: DUF3052 domain-containing protein [Acidimicrobiales bacterium]